MDKGIFFIRDIRDRRAPDVRINITPGSGTVVRVIAGLDESFSVGPTQ